MCKNYFENRNLNHHSSHKCHQWNSDNSVVSHRWYNNSRQHSHNNARHKRHVRNSANNDSRFNHPRHNSHQYCRYLSQHHSSHKRHQWNCDNSVVSHRGPNNTWQHGHNNACHKRHNWNRCHEYRHINYSWYNSHWNNSHDWYVSFMFSSSSDCYLNLLHSM